MRKIHSKKLFKFLLDKGVLDGSEEAIQQAKREYVRLYKKEWKLRNTRQKEIRISLTVKEFTALQKLSEGVGLKPTTLVHDLAISAIENKPFIVDRDTLLEVLQHIGLAYMNIYQNSPNSDAENYLLRCESLLVHYFNRHVKNDNQTVAPAQS